MAHGTRAGAAARTPAGDNRAAARRPSGGRHGPFRCSLPFLRLLLRSTRARPPPPDRRQNSVRGFGGLFRKGALGDSRGRRQIFFRIFPPRTSALRATFPKIRGAPRGFPRAGVPFPARPPGQEPRRWARRAKFPGCFSPRDTPLGAKTGGKVPVLSASPP